MHLVGETFQVKRMHRAFQAQVKGMFTLPVSHETLSSAIDARRRPQAHGQGREVAEHQRLTQAAG